MGRKRQNNQSQPQHEAEAAAPSQSPKRAANKGGLPEKPAYVDVRSLKLTEYITDSALEFNPKTKEVWELTQAQQNFREQFKAKDTLVLQGPAGSGKTDITAREVLGFLQAGGCKRVILTAPVDEGGEDIGFEPGDTKEKMYDHVSQYLSAFAGHLGNGNIDNGEKILKSLLFQNVIKLRSLGKLSGENLRDTVLIVDEAHKASYPHLLNASKRLHHIGSKVIISGDEAQHLRQGVSAFREFVKRFSDPAYAQYVGVIKYSADDVKRHPLLKIMTERGDDIPPGLAARLKEEEYTPEKIASMLSKHFSDAKRDPMADQLVRILLNRLQTHEVLDMLDGQQNPGRETPDQDYTAPTPA